MRCALLALGVVLAAPALRAEPKLEWDPSWARVRPWEYVAGPALVAEGLVVRFAGPDPPSNWHGGILFDDAVRDALAVRGAARGTIADASDVAFFGAMGFRLIDSALFPGLKYGAWDVALQLSFIDMESFGIVATVLWTTQLVVGRDRPYLRTCRSDPAFAAREADCIPHDDWYRSFFSGHPAVGVTAAALTCLHHSQLPLYGGGVADDLACGATIAAAAVTAAGRIMTEKHYASDVVIGVGVGLLAGYVVPKTLHYGWGRARRPAERSAAVIPALVPDGIGVAVVGAM